MGLMVVVLLSFGSCLPTVDPLFDVEMQGDFSMPANLNTIETHFFILRDVPTFYQNNADLRGIALDDVTSISPGSAVLTSVLTPVDWTFVQTVEVWVIDQEDASQRYQLFFSREPDFVNRREINLFNTLANAKDVLSDPLVDLEVRIKTRSFLPGNIDARLTMQYGVFNEE